MIPMERGRIFKILTEIFPDDGVWRDECVVPYIMKEDASNPHDINFLCPDNTHLNGYHDIDYWLRIINPRDDCPEYNFVLHSAISSRDANIAIDGAGNYRIYGDEINSIIFTTIKNNIRKFCDYAVELTELENRQAFEHVIAIIDTYTNELMDIHAGEFVQRDMIPRNDCTYFVIKKSPYMWNALGVDVLRHFHKECVHSNDVWVRFDFGNSCCTPIQIYPFRHEVKLEGGQLEKLTGDVITMAECVHIAERIAKDLEYFVTTDSGNTWVKKAVGDINTTRKLRRDEPGAIIDSIVEKMVLVTLDWIEIMMHQGVFRGYVCDCEYNVFMLSNNRHVQIRYLTDVIAVQIDGETVIEVTKRNKNWQVVLVLTIDHILKTNKPFTLHQITCLADMIREKLRIEHLYLNDTDRVLEKTSDGSYTVTDSGGKGIREFFCGVQTPKPNAPEKVTDDLATGSLKEDVLKPLATQMEEIVDKKIRKFVESGRLLYTSKDYLTDQIFSQLKNDWQKDVYLSVYSSVWCTLAESRFKSAAFELEKHFMEYVTLDNDDCFTVRFGLQKIDDNLPGIEIKFYSATQDIYVRMLDHKSSGSGTWSRPLIQLKSGSESKVYFDTFKNTNCTYKSFLANVVSKIVLLEGLS